MNKEYSFILVYPSLRKIRKIVVDKKKKTVIYGVNIPKLFTKYLDEEVEDWKNRLFELSLIHNKENNKIEIVMSEVEEGGYV